MPVLAIRSTACPPIYACPSEDWTGRIARADKRGAIPAATPPVLRRLGLGEDQWQTQATGIEQRYWRAVGAVDALIDKARAMRRCWLKGSGRAATRAVGVAP